MDKKLYIIAGSNGAGKTTASFTMLPEILACDEFVNADEIARGLSPFNPESVSMRAGRLFIHRINRLLDENATFAFETTLASRSFVDFIRRAKIKGYETSLLFFWLKSEDMAIQRVKKRVFEGGHNIPELVIRRRYQRGIKNLVNLYLSKVDKWMIVDNTHKVPHLIAIHSTGTTEVKNDFIFNRIRTYAK